MTALQRESLQRIYPVGPERGGWDALGVFVAVVIAIAVICGGAL